MNLIQLLIDTAMGMLMFAVFPQIYQTYKNRKNIKDVSFAFSFVTLTGNILAITWGFIVSQWSILVLNLVYAIWSASSLYWMLRKG